MSCATNDTTRPPREEWSRVVPRLRPTHTGSPRASDALRLRTPTERTVLAVPATILRGASPCGQIGARRYSRVRKVWVYGSGHRDRRQAVPCGAGADHLER